MYNEPCMGTGVCLELWVWDCFESEENTYIVATLYAITCVRDSYTGCMNLHVVIK